MPDLEGLLKSAPIPDSVRADAWDAYHAAAGPQDLAARMAKLPLPNSVKADLWDQKNVETPPVDMRPRNVGPAPKPETPPEQQGMFRSFYEGAIGPVIDMVKDAFERKSRGEIFGEHAASQILDSFKEQVKNFNGAIRHWPFNEPGKDPVAMLPIVGQGATATAARMQKQFDAGNYTGMLGSAAGFVAPFATGAAGDLLKENAPAIADAARTAGTAVKGGAAGAAKAATETAQFKGFSLPGGNVMAGAVAGGYAAHALGLPSEAGAVVGAAAPVVRGAVSGARAALAARVAKIAAAQKILDPATASEILNEINGGASAEASAEPAAAIPQPKVASQKLQASIDAFNKARLAANRSGSAPEASAPAESEPAADGLTEAQRIEDAADEQAARLQHQAEDIIWANRARRADRFAEYLTRNKLDPTPGNIAKAAKEMAEKGGPPSAETVDMIADRMNYKPPAEASGEQGAKPEASKAAAGEPSELELLLEKSLDAIKAAKKPR
jgi:hypothetical protein